MTEIKKVCSNNTHVLYKLTYFMQFIICHIWYDSLSDSIQKNQYECVLYKLIQFHKREVWSFDFNDVVSMLQHERSCDSLQSSHISIFIVYCESECAQCASCMVIFISYTFWQNKNRRNPCLWRMILFFIHFILKNVSKLFSCAVNVIHFYHIRIIAQKRNQHTETHYHLWTYLYFFFPFFYQLQK